MSFASLQLNMRAAFRERLLTLVDIDHAPGVSVTLANGVFTRASGSWKTAGFAAGMEVQVLGFTGSPLYGQVRAVSDLALTTNIAGAETVAGGGEFIVALPRGRAWQGDEFFPNGGEPYVAESFTTVSSRGTSIGNPNGGGGVEHRLQGSVTFNYPMGQGTLTVERISGACCALFRRGISLSRGGDSAMSIDVSASPTYQAGSTIARAVTATFLAHTFD